MKRFFLSGKEISVDEKNLILNGKHARRIYCRADQIGIPEKWLTDSLTTVNGELDLKDPLLQIIIEKIPLAETLIVLIDDEPSTDPLSKPRGAVFICK